MMSLKVLWHRLEAAASRLQLTGLLATLLWQARLWRRDRRRLAELQQRKPVELSPGAPTPLVSILLPAWNESESIEDALRSILALRYPEKQVIVCAGGTDDTLARAQAYAGNHVRVLEQQPGEGKQRALRRCYAHAAGEIIFLTDADCLVDDVSFERTLAPLLASGEGASTGAWRPLTDQTDHPLVRYQWSQHLYRELWMGEYAGSIDGRNAAIRREVLDDVGAFVLDTPIGTDFVLSRQLEAGGYAIRFARGSRVRTRYPQTVPAYWRQLSRWFRNPLVLGWQWGNRRLALHILVQGVIAIALLLAPLFMVVTRSKAFLAGVRNVVIYLLLSTVRREHLLRPNDRVKEVMASSLGNVAYLPVSWSGIALGLLDTVHAARRDHW